MGFFTKLTTEIMKSMSASQAEKLRSMAKDPRVPAQKREELLNKAEQADLYNMRIKASNRDFYNEKEKERFIEDETKRIRYKYQDLKASIRRRYDD